MKPYIHCDYYQKTIGRSLKNYVTDNEIFSNSKTALCIFFAF